MQTSEGIEEIAKALAAAQAEFTPIVKDKTAKIKTESGEYQYKYADLQAVLAATVPALNKHGIAQSQSPTIEGTAVSVETRLLHASGQWVASTVAMQSTGKYPETPQALGSTLTYARRYGYSALVGVSPDEDDDGKAGTGPTTKQAPETQNFPPEPAAPPDDDPPETTENTPACKCGNCDACLTRLLFGALNKIGRAKDQKELSAFCVNPKLNEFQVKLRAAGREADCEKIVAAIESRGRELA